MSNPSALSAIEYEAEGAGAFGEDVASFATHRLPIRGPVDASGLLHPKVDPERSQQTRQGGSPYVIMAQGGSFKTKLDLPGHGSTMVGSPTLDAIETIFGYVWGNVALSSAASTTLTGGTAAVPTTTASGTFSAGSMCRIGSVNDARGGGQFYGIATHVTTSLTLLNAMNAGATNGDVLYPVTCIYPAETVTSSAFAPGVGAGTVPGLRFRLLTGNLRYECHGCYPTSVSLTGLNVGERPTAEITWAVSWWRLTTGTFPSVVASNQYNPAPIAAGSLNVNTIGTTTINRRAARNFTVNYKLGIVPLPGPGGANIYQTVVGCRRTVDEIRVSWTEDADAATTTPVLEGYWLDGLPRHLEWSGSVTNGSAIGILMRSINICDARPVQKMDGGINRIMVTAEANTGATLTNDLTQTAFILGFS